MNAVDAENFRTLQAKFKNTRQWTPDQVIDTIRQRLNTLAQSLARMHAIIGGPGAENEPLPSWDDLAIFQRQVAQQIASVQQMLRDHSQFLTTDHVFASTAFPAEREPMLNMLLAKRLAPDLDTWYDQSQTLGEKTNNASALSEGAEVDWQKLWEWAGPAANEIVREVVMGGEDEDEEDEDDEMEDDAEPEDTAKAGTDPVASTTAKRQQAPETGQGMSLEQILKFMNTGVVGSPSNTRQT